jgi:hypothetical protein
MQLETIYQSAAIAVVAVIVIFAAFGHSLGYPPKSEE